MAHVFVIGAAAGAVGSIVGASANRDARSRHTTARLSVTSLALVPLSKRKHGKGSQSPCLRDDDALRAVVVSEKIPKRVC